MHTQYQHRHLGALCMELFQHVQAKVLGAVLNGAGVEVAHEGYSYYAY